MKSLMYSPRNGADIKFNSVPRVQKRSDLLKCTLSFCCRSKDSLHLQSWPIELIAGSCPPSSSDSWPSDGERWRVLPFPSDLTSRRPLRRGDPTRGRPPWRLCIRQPSRWSLIWQADVGVESHWRQSISACNRNLVQCSIGFDLPYFDSSHSRFDFI